MQVLTYGFTFALDKNDIEVGDALDGVAGPNSDAVRFTVSYAMDFEL